MFVRHAGNEAGTRKKTPGPTVGSPVRKTVMDPMVATLDSEGEVASGSDSESAHAVFPRTAGKEPRTKVLQRMPPGKEPRTKVLQRMPPTIQVLRPALLDELATKQSTDQF